MTVPELTCSPTDAAGAMSSAEYQYCPAYGPAVSSSEMKTPPGHPEL
jgi:hypothetical protein